MAPEYLYRGEISTHSDIYSLGLLIIQISTGEKNIPDAEDKCGTKFIDRVRSCYLIFFEDSNYSYSID